MPQRSTPSSILLVATITLIVLSLLAAFWLRYHKTAPTPSIKGTASPNLPNEPKVSARCVAGLFHSDSDAENAIAELNEAGFSQAEIGVATAGHAEKKTHKSFWNKVTGVFSKSEHTRTGRQGRRATNVRVTALVPCHFWPRVQWASSPL